MGFLPDLRKIGRRNFLKAVGGTSALAALGGAVVLRGPRRGGPVRAALIGWGAQGKTLQASIDPQVMDLVAIADIRPLPIAGRDSSPRAVWYQDWRQMLQREKLEAVIVATPLCTHAEIAIACLEQRKHVLCETAMAKDEAGCQGMIDAATRNHRTLAIGFQDFYQPVYRAAFQNIMQQGLLGDVYSVEAAWHSYSSGRITPDADEARFDPHPWGYASEDELLNWRLFRRYSGGLIFENGGRLISLANWFLNATPTAVQATGGLYSYKDGRDVDDHFFTTLEYPNGRTATVSLIQSNGLEGSYTQLMGTKGTLILGNNEAMLFTEETGSATKVESTRLIGAQPVLDASASRSAEASDHSVIASGKSENNGDELQAYRQEVSAFCGAIRTGAPMRSSPYGALAVARTCFAARDSKEQGKRVLLAGTARTNESAVSSDQQKRGLHV